MSYCRWSCMDYKCDLCVYDGEGGICIHVGSKRVIGDVPPLDWVDGNGSEALYKSYVEQMKFMKTAQYERIGLIHDGCSWVGLTEKEAVNVLVKLKREGYVFPDSVIEELSKISC